MTPDAFWNHWRDAVKKQSQGRLCLPLTYRVTELPAIVDIAEMVPNDADLAAVVETFLTMPQKEQQRHNVKAFTLGYLRMALPMLMAEHVNEQAEGQKFLDRLNTYR